MAKLYCAEFSHLFLLHTPSHYQCFVSFTQLSYVDKMSYFYKYNLISIMWHGLDDP